MSVTVQNYAILARRTAKVMGCRDMLGHGALGLLTEVGELGEANLDLKTADYIIKELGDVMWFCAYIYQANFGVPMELHVLPAPQEVTRPFSRENYQLLKCASNVGTMIKARLYYDKPLNGAALSDELYACIASVRQICLGFCIPFEEVLQTNIEKLRLRYPDKYTDQDAVERKDEADPAGATPAYVNQD